MVPRNSSNAIIIVIMSCVIVSEATEFILN